MMMKSEDIKVGDKVKFEYRKETVIATVKRVNQKSVSIEGEGFRGRVAYHFLSPAGEKDEVSAKLPEKKPTAPRKKPSRRSRTRLRRPMASVAKRS